MNADKVKDDAQDYLEAYTNAHGAPGFESEVAELLHGSLNPWGKHASDNNGSTAFTKGSGKKHIMIAAHMDEVGFRVQNISSSGFLKFVPVGGWWGHTLLAQRVLIKTKAGNKILGVIGSKPVHFLSKTDRTKVLGLNDMYIDVGASSREDVEEMGIRLGDPVTPETSFRPMAKDGLFNAKAFDNRVGCAALPQVADLLPEGVKGAELSLAATVQEELGKRGAKTLTNVLKPDFAIVLEGTPADDTPGFKSDESQGGVGKGVQIRLHDPSAIMSPFMVDLAIKTAEEMKIPHQIAVRISGGTDAGAFAYANEGIPSIVLGVPARYIHTHNSIIDINDHIAMVHLAVELAKNLAKA